MESKIRNLSILFIILILITGSVSLTHAVDSDQDIIRINNKINATKHKLIQIIKLPLTGVTEIIPAEISVTYPEFKTLNKDSKTVVEKINMAVQKRLLDTEIISDTNFSSITELINRFSEDFKSAMSKEPESIGAWSLKLEVLIRFSNEDILSLDIMDSLFNGGAHPISNITYHVFSLKTGQPITLSELISENKSDDFLKVAEKQFRKQKKIPENTSYSDAGFNFTDDKFVLNTNFLIFKKGLLFYYNPYEIAPYGMGATRLFIPWSKLNNIVDPQSPAGNFLKR